MPLTSVEICAGAGGQALGLRAGFHHVAAVEIDPHAVGTLRLNRPEWNVEQADLLQWEPPAELVGNLDLLAGGVPCPPFSLAGKQLGEADERNLFPRALELVEILSPRAVMLENVRGLLSKRFDDYRRVISDRLSELGYVPQWKLLTSAEYGVPQLRPRTILVALRKQESEFVFPQGDLSSAPTVGEVLERPMASAGWEGAEDWALKANTIAPTLVGGSKKHGGADLGPTRAKEAWLKLGVDGKGLANEPPAPGFTGIPRLTVPMAALLQGFPTEWQFVGGKTSAYRQVGNAFPPPVAEAVGRQIKEALHG